MSTEARRRFASVQKIPKIFQERVDMGEIRIREIA